MSEQNAHEHEKKEEPPKSAKNPENQKKKDHTWKYLACCGCAGLVAFLLLAMASWQFIFPGLLALGDLNNSSNTAKTTSAPSSSPSTSSPSSKSSQSYATPQACSQVQTEPSTALAVSSSNPGLKTNANTHFYAVYGPTANIIREQLGSCGPIVGDRHWDAVTNNYMNWTYDYRTSGNSCGVKNVVVGVNVNIYLPKWEAPDKYASGLNNQWQKYIDALTYHENGHRDIGFNGGQKILDALNNIGTASTCDEISTKANDLGYQIMDQSNAENSSYDETTQHGLTQGTQFP